MDGVIIDSEPFHKACEKKIFRMLGISVSDEEHHSYVGTTHETMWSQIDFILKGLDIKHLVHSIISGEDVDKGKPYPEIFLKVAGMAGINPGSCLVIEDSFNGVTAAKNAKMKCIGYINPNSGDQELSKADMVVHSLEKISVRLIRNLLNNC